MQLVSSFNRAHLLHVTQGMSKKIPEGSMRICLFSLYRKNSYPVIQKKIENRAYCVETF